MNLAILALLLPALATPLPIAQDVEKRQAWAPWGNAGTGQVISHGTSAQQGVPVQNSGLHGWSFSPDGSALRRDSEAEPDAHVTEAELEALVARDMICDKSPDGPTNDNPGRDVLATLLCGVVEDLDGPAMAFGFIPRDVFTTLLCGVVEDLEGPAMAFGLIPRDVAESLRDAMTVGLSTV
ncbi:hypothetical protein CspHIS471_0402580 [Cutaneotrichosporon sp. HIS471]|nr:hypothetical protein CspHIS471_0402580 [Cutaneotrichosporon sp. HIS471]